MPKVEEFYPSRASGSDDHLTEDGEGTAQCCSEDEDDDENDACEIVNPTRPRPRCSIAGFALLKKMERSETITLGILDNF